jgi:hypothetical protein
MKEEKGVLQDAIEADQPKEEGKTRKYIRITMVVIFMSFFALVIVMATLRRCEG